MISWNERFPLESLGVMPLEDALSILGIRSIILSRLDEAVTAFPVAIADIVSDFSKNM